MNAKGFEATLEELAKKENPRYPEDWLSELDYNVTPGKAYEVKSEIVRVECIDAVTGGEDKFAGGEGPVYIVFKVTSSGGEQFFKKTGIYRSFDGVEWYGGFTEVKPTEKTVVVYE